METYNEDKYGQVIAENISRPVRETKLEVIDYAPASNQATRLTAPGTVTLYIAKGGSKHIDTVRAAVKEHSRAEEMKGYIEKQLKQTSAVAPHHLPELMLRQPLLADVRYGGDTLMHGFFLPEGVDLFPIPLAYNGGSLAREGFTLVEHYREGSDAAFEAIVVRSSPSLTPAEEAALRLVPQTQLVNNVAVLRDWCDTTWWVVAAAVIAVTEVTIQATCICAAMAAVHLPEETLKALGPAASARELTQLRTQALVKSLPADR